MPVTPFHFGPHACIGLPLRKRLDVANFLLANIVIDIEPGLVMLFNLDYPLHGYAHTLIGSIFVGWLCGGIGYRLRQPLRKIMDFFKLPYSPSLKIGIISGMLGSIVHVLFDAPIYEDIRPFFPLQINPLYGLISLLDMYLLCTLLFIPAFLLYRFIVKQSEEGHEK